MHSIELEAGFTNVKYYYSSPQSPFSTFQTQNNGNNVIDEKETTTSSSFSRISPLILLVIIILAIIFFIYGLIHLVLWFLLKRPSSQPLYNSNRFQETTPTRSLQRQLQHLFNLHDSGLEKAVIDTFPVFNYKDLMGLKEPFDCAICLSEFSEVDKLRLLPMCTHAFHMNCLDTWLLSNSTCPLCRATFSSSGFHVENVENSLVLPRVIDEEENNFGFSDSEKSITVEEEISGKRVFSVRLGKFRNNNGLDLDGSCSLDERRCYSMGSYEYVVRDLNLQVVLSRCCDEREGECGEVGRGYPLENGNVEGKRIGNRGKGESFSVSKIWLWSKKSKFPSSDVAFP